jgi:hypothetical protein
VTERVLVCPFEPALLARLRGRAVVLQLDDVAQLDEAAACAGQHDLRLQCLQVRTLLALTDVHPRVAWTWPLALHVPRMGPVLDFLKLLPVLHQLNLRVALPSDDLASYRDLRIMASLGLTCVVDFRPTVHWDELADLMTYALLSPVPHGSVSPFHDVADAYAPRQRTDFGRVYFEDPAVYLHVDRQGRVALTAAALAAGQFIAQDAAGLTDVEALPAYREHAERWRQVFLAKDGCAACAGWRVCLAKFAPPQGPGCSEFFTELMDVVERQQRVARPRKTVWRP